MTAEEFQSFWATAFPGIPPIAHLFRQKLVGRWLRIHSLPESKRYAESVADWQTLLQRQHTIFTDLFGDNSALMLTGYYALNTDDQEASLREFLLDHEVFAGLIFTELPAIELHLINPNEYAPSMLYRPLLAELTASASQVDAILRAIADDKVRAFFSSQKVNGTLIAPYDGGIDLIFQDAKTRDYYRQQYSVWLSERADGL